MSLQSVISLYPLNNEFIASYHLKNESIAVRNTAEYQTIIIMDRSGSMGNQAERLATKILPLFFAKLSYQYSNIIHFITFDSSAELHTVPVSAFSTLPIQCRGNTFMRPALEKCQQVFISMNSSLPVRVLTISDGEVHDQQETAAAAANLQRFLNQSNYFINSKAVRLFTSTSQPDTTALGSLLRINNAIPRSLEDINASQSDDFIATEMAELFMNDNFGNFNSLTTPQSVILQYPWNLTNSSTLTLLPGENVFWLKSLPSEFKVNGVKTTSSMEQPLNTDNFEKVMKPKFDMIIEKMKVLKVVGSSEATLIVDQMNHYFQITLLNLPKGVKKVSDMTIFKDINNIAKDQTVFKMSAAEKALYLSKQ